MQLSTWKIHRYGVVDLDSEQCNLSESSDSRQLIKEKQR